ncbi:DNA-directed RNA polymerase subunit beta' [Candidatus Roizmanbacteria bacterium CG22_combo_CG10-13_8_21_14_all_38_20]|uniref:DNA-directed RNA polymerase subunit beta' n=1 Tax=Candidatus Roizmanbacteria bacterium CG22_combo_CG10-13_8_21_14_all_38_20 TaxID=1974862 RepID=A0A2H0BWB2_9BACT|nr:DNA-directed RNA polymerase subunit beta' [Candidatus Microgenomates bacterium]PIP61967.1 MAG: DNA-directed RNA polymerase subunit beta' [Candidatus Roizmanbacteria bacterium CG22_combo_CG10-13_8_21_14_all_38_20]PJC31905.1 MAG: DNA-directed RNA polymerase subunit beta' [Candidatus Roizmanbacteria bacterium CG_4_9_14_0_2_um_filter_38_17]
MVLFKQQIKNITDFGGLQIKLASPEEILSWSYGEVTKPETINYRTLKPEKDGLFDERIYGPTKDWECYCGKYKRVRYRGIICDKCGVEVTHSRVRRERMGHITLATPVAHVWFFRGAPSKLSLLLDMSAKDLESVIYFSSYIIIDVEEDKRKNALADLEKGLKEKIEAITQLYAQEKEKLESLFKDRETEAKGSKSSSKESTELAMSELKLKGKQRVANVSERENVEKGQAEELMTRLMRLIKDLRPHSVLTEDEYFSLSEYTNLDFLKVGIGADGLLDVMKRLDLNKTMTNLRKKIDKVKGQQLVKLIKRLRTIEEFKNAGIDPSWMIWRVLPVIPPDLRPMVQLSGGRFATSDLNDLYRRVINRNNRLKHLIDLGAPEIILRNEKRMLQESVDALIDKTQRRRRYGKELKSLSDMLKGKQGRFRQNLLGKRVDYSGRSVIVVGPELKLNQCGLPKEMALEMFKPFILHELVVRELCPNVKRARTFLDERHAEVFDILEEVIKDHPVLLNRAPTLHKLGIQAFYPLLIEGQAIRIHPCVCSGYNADFDGDQMAVHIPLSKAAIKESAESMTPVQNLLKPADGSPVSVPNKEMAVGCYYLTSLDPELVDKKDEDLKVFSSGYDAILASDSGLISIREPIRVRLSAGNIVRTTVGRIRFNEVLPEEMEFFNETVDQKQLKAFVKNAMGDYSNEKVAGMIDAFKNLGFWGSIRSGGLSVSVFDNEMVADKDKMIKEAEVRTSEAEENYNQGLITDTERRSLSNDIWIETTEKLADLTWDNMSSTNPIRHIIQSGGARASRDQLKQLAAMRGLVVDPLGKIVELPTKSNFREGLSIFEYVTSTRGSRKGLTDSALKTADAGYLTRRLVDVAHDAIIREDDCGAGQGFEIVAYDHRQATFAERIAGRFLAADVLVPNAKKVLYKAGAYILEEDAAKIAESGITEVVVRSPITCNTEYGMCAKCYGRDFATLEQVELGTPVGVVAAQSIGEPGTQLTMRVKHAGGIVGLDVTQGLPRIEELFEARTPKVQSPIAEISGKVSVEEGQGWVVTIQGVGSSDDETREYHIPHILQLSVKDGQLIEAGEQLSSGFLNLQDVLKVRGLRGSQLYLLDEIQRVYESQGIPINDKHLEVIIRKMSEKVHIDTAGDTTLTVGEVINRDTFEKTNAQILAEGGEAATGSVTILGITKVALHTESWLSAASFQRTTQVLTNSATKGDIDQLRGLKENVIIGRLIPTSPERAVMLN